MTTEDDFQRSLDANPDDHDTRRVFADWLQDRDDPRAEGYRALGVNRRCPYVRGVTRKEGFAWWMRGGMFDGTGYLLPDDWFARLPTPWKCSIFAPSAGLIPRNIHSHTRAACEDDAARAFSLLPAERRAELLATRPEGVRA